MEAQRLITWYWSPVWQPSNLCYRHRLPPQLWRSNRTATWLTRVSSLIQSSASVFQEFTARWCNTFLFGLSIVSCKLMLFTVAIHERKPFTTFELHDENFQEYRAAYSPTLADCHFYLALPSQLSKATAHWNIVMRMPIATSSSPRV